MGKIREISNKTYIANCNMKNGMSFDDMRLIMYQQGLIAPYERGISNSKEMLDVLSYASNYYQQKEDIVKNRK